VSKRFLYLTNSRLVSVITQGKRIAARREFAVSGAGATEFDRHLATMADVPTYLFTDLTEEDFRLDTIPHVSVRDREAIVGRKLAQIFRSTPFRHAAMQGRESEGRRDDRVIYTAITNPEVLRPWIEAMERNRVPLEGIYSAAVFSSMLLEELDLVFPHALLVTFTPGNAMRQTYFRDNEIKFSRLTPVDLAEGQTLGAMIAEETTRTWQYLDSLRNFAAEDRLEVCVVVHASDRPAVQPDLRDFAQIQYRVIDIEQASMKLGLKPAPLDSSAEELMIHLFLLRPAANHFASPEQRRHSSLRRARIFLNQAAGLVLLAGIAWGGYNLSGALQVSQVDEQLARQISDLNRTRDEITRSMPSFGVGGATMRDAVAFYNGQIRNFPSMPAFLAPLSRVLAAQPDVRLTQISWQATDDAKALPPLTPGTTRGTPTVAAVKSAGERAAPQSPESLTNPPFAGGKYEVALLEATVVVGTDDYRGALERAQALAEAMSRVPGYHADVVESPIDTRPTLSIVGRHGEREPATMEPRFVLRVMRERGAA
jgi:hypothetical protein